MKNSVQYIIACSFLLGLFLFKRVGFACAKVWERDRSAKP